VGSKIQKIENHGLNPTYLIVLCMSTVTLFLTHLEYKLIFRFLLFKYQEPSNAPS